MRLLRNFDEYVIDGVVKKRTPDIGRARSLIEQTENRSKFLAEMSEKIGLTDENANYFIEYSYDVLIELVRAKLLLDGFSSSGERAHEAEVAYMRNMGFSEHDARFINDLRFYRNGIKYYGKSFGKDYAEKVLVFLDEMYPKLRDIVGKIA